MAEAIILPNPALTRMRGGDVALGMVVRLGRSGDIARIAALARAATDRGRQALHFCEEARQHRCRRWT